VLRKSLNIKYLAITGLLIIFLIGVEIILSLFGVQQSVVFPIFWMTFFWWILFGKKLLKKRMQ